MIWLSSDWHFGHQKDFLYKPRGFNNSEENDTAIIENHNRLVAPEDEVYVLGDLMLGNNEHGLQCVKQLNGKIHIIRGNHDTDTRLELYKEIPNVVEICEAKTIKVGKQHYFLCHYPTITANYDDKPYHSHLINLFGHTHQQENFYNDNPFMYHVGVDSHNCCPVSIEQVNKEIHNKINQLYKEKNAAAALFKFAEAYKDGIEYFSNHPLGNEILD